MPILIEEREFLTKRLLHLAIVCLRLSLVCFLALLPEALRAEESNDPEGVDGGAFSIVNTHFGRYLDQGTTLSILHTTDDRLWISNYEGVIKARGGSISYNDELFDSGSGFAQLRIRKLIEIWDGDIVAVTDSNDILVYEKSLGFFSTPVWFNSSIAGTVSDLFFSSKNLLWIGLTNGKVLKVHKDKSIEKVENLEISDGITDFYEDKENSFFLVAGGNVVARKNHKTNHVDSFDVVQVCNNTSPIKEIAQKPNGEIWIGTFGGGLLSIDTSTLVCQQIDSNINTQKNFLRATIHDITVDRSTGLSIVSSDQGIFVFNGHKAVQNLTASNSKLLNNEVISVTADRSGGYWVGTYNGINRLIVSPFELFDQQTHEDLHSVVAFESIADEGILVASYSGLILTGTNSRIFSRFNEYSPSITMYGERIMSLFVDSRKIYLGYRYSGFEVIDLEQRISFRLDTSLLDGLASDSISAFLPLSSEEILIGTYGGGLTIFRSPEYSVNININSTEQPLRDNRILMLFKSSDGTVWVGTEGGLQVFNPNTRHFYDVAFASSNSDSGHNTIVWSMAESADYLWFGSLRNGMFKLDKSETLGDFSQGRLEHVTTNSTDSRLTVYAIEVGSGNEVWFSTNRGISRLAENGDILNFGNSHGLQETEFELGSSYKDSGGFIYFGGNHGYNRFAPKNIKIQSRPSEVVLNRIILDNEILTSRTPISTLESIILSHKDRFITFEFSALDYADPESTRYRHKLVGFDPDWIDIGNRGAATYTNLPSGEYVFRVQAVNSAGIWNYDGLALNLRVEPAFWLTWWAYVSYVIVALAFVAVCLKFFRNYTLKDQQIKQANEMQRIADRIADELQDKIDFQSKFTNSIHSYNKEILYWAKFCTNSTTEYGAVEPGLVHDRILFRLDVLESVQDSLYYQGERLYANLHDCATRLVNKLCRSHPNECSQVTTVNDIQKELLPAAQAVPLAIVLAELLDNSLTHAFDAKRAAGFISFSLTFTADPTSATDTVRLVYQDDGCGIPPGLAFDSPESAGFAIIRHAAEILDCELVISEKDRRMVTASFAVSWS